MQPPFDAEQAAADRWRCDLCDGERCEPIATRDRAGAPLETVVCLRCGLVTHGALPTERQLADYYRRRYRAEYQGGAAAAPRRLSRAARAGRARFARLAPLLRAPARVLEVGAGLGCTLLPFARAGHEVQGVEPDPALAAFAHERLGLAVAPGRLEELAPPAPPGFDLVLLVHVLEHVSSPRAALTRLAETLAPDGLLYVECPNLAAPFAPPARLFHRAHVYNLIPSTLAGLARRAGLEVTRSFAPPGDPTLALLLRRAQAPLPWTPDPTAVSTVRAALATSTLRYHLRPAALALRLLKLRERAHDLVWARHEARRLLG